MPEEKPYFCRHCKNPLGISSGTVLTIGLAEFRLTSTFKCRHCRREQTWRPAEKKNISANTVLLSPAV